VSGVQVLIATAITGTVQALMGGQPLLIVGVAEPIVLIYSFMYSFAKGEGHFNSRNPFYGMQWHCDMAGNGMASNGMVVRWNTLWVINHRSLTLNSNHYILAFTLPSEVPLHFRRRYRA
jgi:hypothetical protein